MSYGTKKRIKMLEQNFNKNLNEIKNGKKKEKQKKPKIVVEEPEQIPAGDEELTNEKIEELVEEDTKLPLDIQPDVQGEESPF